MFKTKETSVTASQMKISHVALAPKLAARPSGVPSIISAEMRVQGNFRSGGDLQVEGAVIGDIEVARLVITEGGTVNGNIVAEDVKICGCLTGSVRSPVVVLTSTGQVLGDIHHDLLTIERGGRLEGYSKRIVLDGGVAVATPVLEVVAPPVEQHWENGHDQNHHEHQHHEHQHHEHH